MVSADGSSPAIPLALVFSASDIGSPHDSP